MIPSLLQIPSAVSDSKLHSVLPNNGKGDFTFDRSTGATRINKDGLIEEVGYFSSELVQNGNFSELGSELAPADDFAADFVANPSSGTVVNSPNGTLTFTNSTSTGANVQLKNRSVTTTKTYKIQFTISNYVSGTFKMSVGNQISNAASANGTYTFYIEYTSGLNRNYFYTTNSTLTVSNISVKQVDPNDRWTLGTGWSFGDGIVEANNTSSFFSQSGLIEASKLYKLTFQARLKSGTNGTINAYIGGSNNQQFTISNTDWQSFTYVDTRGSSIADSIYFNNNGTELELDNISVVEVQGDRPRLSYDITNGVVEDKPHLLLEPSSTNVFTFSNFFGSGALEIYSNGTETHTVTNNYSISPDGTKNAIRLQATVGSSSSDRVVLRDLVSAGATTFTFSVYAKSNTTENITLGFHSGGGTPSTFVATPDWQRFTYTATLTATSNVGVEVRGGQTSSNVDVSLFGYQLEQQSYATSYIPTAGTTITRAAETCNNSKPSVNSTEGVLYAEYKPTFAAGSRQITISDGTYDERIVFECRESGTKLRANIAAGGVGQTEITIPISSLDKYYKIAIQYKANDVSFYIDGELKGTDTSATMPTGMNVVSFSGRNDASLIMTGKTKGVAVYNEALSESQLMQLTGVTASSIYSNFVTRTASFTVEALNEVKKVIDNL